MNCSNYLPKPQTNKSIIYAMAISVGAFWNHPIDSVRISDFIDSHIDQSQYKHNFVIQFLFVTPQSVKILYISEFFSPCVQWFSLYTVN